MNTRNLLIGVLLSALAVGAQAKTKRVDYSAYAGESVSEFRYTQLYNWQRTSDKSLVVWTKPSKAYLLTLRNNCSALAGNYSLQIGGVDGIELRVRAGTDNVQVGQLRCKIDTIQPLDLARMKAERA
jgi:hypothetical protein